MAKKWKKKEIEDYISTKQISQENYVAPTVEIGTAPSYKSVANTVDTFNNVSNNIKNKTTMSFDDEEPTTGQKLGFIGKSAGAGLTSGVTGIVDAPLQNIQEGAQKGKKKGKLENYLQGLARTLDIYGLSTMPETAKEVQQIVQDKNKKGWEKALNIGGTILNNNPLVNNLEASGQQLNIVDKNADKNIKKAREIVETPSNKLNENVAKDSEKMGKGWQIAGEVSQTIGNMIPSMALTAVTKNPDIGLAAMGVSAKGQATKEAEEKGSDLSTANEIGLGKGLVEVGTEKLTGGLKFFGKGTADDLVEAGINKAIKNKAGNFIAKQAVGMAGEVGEETISDLVGTAIDKATVDPDASYSFDDWKKTALMTMLSTGALNTISGGYGRKAYQLNAEELNDIAQSKKVQDTVNERVEQFKTPDMTPEQVEQLREQTTAVVLGEIQQNVDDILDNSIAQLQEQPQIPTQTSINTLSSNIQEQNNQILGQEQTSQITPLNQVNQELQETRQQDVADSVRAMNLEQEPEFTQKQGNYVYEKSDNSKIDTFRKDAATYLKAGEQTDNFVKTLEKIIEDKDIEIRFDPNLRDSQGRMANGSYSNNVITLNPNSNRAGEFLAIHELTHAIGTKSMINMIQKYRKSNAEFDSAVKRLLTTYKATEINEEALGDIAGQLFGNQEYINNLSMENPSLFKKIYNEIKYLWHKFTGYKNQDQFIEDLRNKWESAYRNQKVQQKAKNSNIEMSTQTDSNGNMLSNEQVDYFKNSKVRDENGNLLIMYHGTSEDFNVFDISKLGINSRDNIKGIWLTSDENYASSFASKRMIKSYVNITNRLDELNKTIKLSDLQNAVSEFSKDYDVKVINKPDVIEKIYNKEYASDISIYDAITRSIPFNKQAFFNKYLEKYTGKDGILFQKGDGEYYAVAFNSNQIKNIDNLTPTQDDDIRYSINEDTGKLQENGKDVTLETSKIGSTGTLMAIHNLNEDKLKGILELGGFPVPSIAITNPSKVNHSQFGNISVLFDKNTIDPAVKANEVYDRDVWTPTFPRVEYDINMDNIRKMSKENNIYDDYNDDIVSHVRTNYFYGDNLSDLVDRWGIDEALNKMKEDKELKYLYQKTKNNDYQPQMKPTEYSKEYSNKTLQEYVDMYNNNPFKKMSLPDFYYHYLNYGDMNLTEDETKALKNTVRDYVYKQYKQDAKEEYTRKVKNNPDIKNSLTEEKYVDTLVDMMLESFDKSYFKYKDFIKDASRLDEFGETMSMDRDATLNKVNEEVNQEEFDKWIDNTFGKMLKEAKKGIRNDKEIFTASGNRRSFDKLHEDYNLQNIVNYLTSKKTVAGEEGFGSGQNFGTFQAKLSNKFNSIEDIKQAENKLQFNEQTKELIDNYSTQIYDYMNELGDYSYNKDRSYYYGDNAGYALNDFAGYKTQNEQNLNKALENNGIDSKAVPKELKDNIIKTTNELKNIPTDYFEAKPQRAVGLNEVQQVVIPNNLDTEFKKQLQDAGLSYAEYDPNIEGDRQRVINQFDNLKFSKDNQTWREYLEKEFPSQGTRTNLQDINERNKPKQENKTTKEEKPQEMPKNEVKQEVKKSYLTSAEQNELDGLKSVENSGFAELTPQEQARMEELEKKSQGITKKFPELKKTVTQEDTKPLYFKYKDSEISRENNKILNEAKNIVEANNQGRRTKEQWLQVAEYIGSNADIKNSTDLQKLAMETWLASRPNTKDNLNRQGKKYVDFKTNEWFNAMYKGAGVGTDVKMSLEEKNTINESKQDEVVVLRTPTEIQPKEVKTPEQKQEYFEESGTPKKVAKILSETPRETETSTLREKYQTLKRAVVDKGEAIYRIAKQTKNRRLYAMYDRIGLATGEGNSDIGISQTNLDGESYKNFTDSKGNKTSMSLNDIWKDVEDSNIPENVMNEYLANYLNVDRYKANQLSIEEIEELKDLNKYKNLSKTQKERVEELNTLAETRNVFGKDITREDSLNKIKEIEEKYPQIKRPAENIWQYGKNQLQKMVDAGLVSKESQEYYNENTPHYVRLQRSTENKKGFVFDSKGHLQVNNQIKKAKGGTKDIIPFKDSMAQYTLDTTSSIRKNLFGQELSKTLKNGLETDGNVDIDNIDNNILNANEDGSYTFKIFKDGKPEVLTIDKGIYEALQPNKHYELEKLFTPFRAVSNFKRTVLTDKNPLFLATNFFKDFFDAPLNTKHSTVDFVKNYGVAINQILKNGEYYQKYQALGGNQNTYFDKEGFSKPSKISKIVAPIEKANEFIEMLPRMSEFITSLKKGESLDEAMYNAAEITTNFKRGGTATKIVNRNGATFLNASVQGFDKQIRNFTEIENPKQAARLLTKTLVLGVAPALLNAVMYDDDDEYEDLPDYVKDSYYLFKTGKDNKWIRIPKGRAISVIQAAARRTYNFSKGDKDAYKGLAGHFENQLAPNNPLESNVLSPLVDVKNNKAWSGNKIVSDSIANTSHPEEEYDAKTDELSKWLGQKLGKSPKKINYIIDQNTGAIGDLLLPFLTKQAEGEDDSIAGRLLKNPVKDKFTTDAVLNSKQVNQFYDAFNKAEDDKKWSKATDEDKLKYKYLYSTMLELAEKNKQIKEIESSDKSDKEKYRETKAIKQEMNDMSKKAVKESENIKINDYYAQIDDKVYKKEYDKSTGEYKYTKVQQKQLDKIKDKGVPLSDYFQEAYEKQKKRATK